MTWRMLDLFSGIGGFSLAAQWVWGEDLEIVAFCEIDKFCQRVLRKHWPDVPILEDVRDVKGETLDNTKCTRYMGQSSEITTEQNSDGEKDGLSLTSGSNRIDLLTGGFPCQPFSCAGKRKGKEDNRFLWPEMFRVIQEIRPRWVIAENVAGIVRMELDNCISDLEGEGYSTQAVIIPACAVNAPHRRDRVWIVANNSEQRLERSISKRTSCTKGLPSKCGQDVADSFINSERTTHTQGSNGRRSDSQQDNGNCMGNDFGNGSQTFGWWSTEPDVGRVAHGVPNRVDRLKSLGNAIVPQVAYQIMKAIKETEKS
jgi:DNA (cytosine-5)-methyltransferase 1